jgi:SAM-dependent methyltransferase
VKTGPQTTAAKNFRFFDNRQKYLLFVNTCSEKWVVANRVSMELAKLRPKPPAVRIFDAGVGDGTVLTRVMRATHARFPTMPHFIAGKEISLEDVRLALEKMPDRFFEHPSTVLVLTNMYYSEAPWLRVHSPAAANSLVWKELCLRGGSSHKFEEQITSLEPFLAENWKAKASPKTGNPIYEKPVVLVIYREDHKFLLDPVIPHPGMMKGEYDLVIASQPYRLRVPDEFKAQKVVAPLARALAPGGRLIGVHSHGNDPAHEIVKAVWPGENPFHSTRHSLLQKVKETLGVDGRNLKFNASSEAKAIFRYTMHTLPNELSGSIGTSTLFAAWNAAIYVAQIEDERLTEAVRDGSYLDATSAVLKQYGGLWFNDESYVISRKAE